MHARHQALVQARRARAAASSVVAAARNNNGAASASAAAGSATTRDPRTSLIPDTLREMAEEDPELRELRERASTAQGRAALSRDERAARRRSLAAVGAPPFASALAAAGLPPLTRGAASILQLNVGLRCNQACTHCHVESSPLRTEEMSPQVAARCIELLMRSAGAADGASGGGNSIRALDLTGGAPELSAQFRPLVRAAAALGVQVIDRCNLTVLTEPGQEDLPAFLAEHGVRVVASLPCYGADNVDAQRGRGVFQRSIEGLKMLNAVGYGGAGSSPALQLDLVYNPSGAFLAPSSAELEPAYRRELREAHGVEFGALLCLNNLPVKRFADWLARRGETDAYMRLLVGAFNAGAVGGLMCRDTVSVSHDGSLYDCDFNQQLAMAMVAAAVAGPGGGAGDGAARSASGDGEGTDAVSAAAALAAAAASGGGRPPLTVFDIESLSELEGRAVATDSHCYGCTAGQGSGCQGATAAGA